MISPIRNIKSFLPLSLIDFPNHIASVIFLGGCNFRCDYCANRTLVDRRWELPDLEWDHIAEQLRRRQNFIDGVVVSGGEPTISDDLLPLLQNLHSLGFKVKLDTNGYRPEVLRQSLESGHVDYVAMDIKGPLSQYSAIVGVPINPSLLTASISVIMDSGIPYEFRTTLWKHSVEEEEMDEMLALIRGADNYFLQNFAWNPSCHERSVFLKPLTKKELSRFFEKAMRYVQNLGLRGEWPE